MIRQTPHGLLSFHAASDPSGTSSAACVDPPVSIRACERSGTMSNGPSASPRFHRRSDRASIDVPR